MTLLQRQARVHHVRECWEWEICVLPAGRRLNFDSVSVKPGKV